MQLGWLGEWHRLHLQRIAGVQCGAVHQGAGCSEDPARLLVVVRTLEEEDVEDVWLGPTA